uniref:Tetratricopeptide repeat protein n=1 Tax=Lotharella oceanica TaxID=641309 RepID=A0A7S2TG56_9EUKA
MRKLGRSGGGAYQDEQRLDNDDLALASLNLFAVYLKRKEFRKAAEALQRERTLNPTLGAIAYQMGIVAQKARKASKKEGEASEAARVAEELGDPARWFNEAIKLNPASDSYKKALEKESKT